MSVSCVITFVAELLFVVYFNHSEITDFREKDDKEEGAPLLEEE
jgi:hypothetical protein